MLKIISTGDWHLSPDKLKREKVELSLSQLVDYVRTHKVDYIQIVGDVFDHLVSFKEDTGVDLAYRYIRLLAECVKYVLITKGNNHHDIPGAISMLHKISPNVLAFEYPVVIGIYPDGKWFDLLRNTDKIFDGTQPEIVFDLIPYPSKAIFMSDGNLAENNNNYVEAFTGLMNAVGIVNNKFNCPKVLGFHGNVDGVRLSSGQKIPGKDIIFSPLVLQLAKADSYELNHIHLRQEIIPDLMVYAGGIANFNWGEKERKSVELLTFTPTLEGKWDRSRERIYFTSARQMFDLNAEWMNGDLVFTDESFILKNEIMEIVADDTRLNPEVRITIKTTDIEKRLITDNDEAAINEKLGGLVKFKYDLSDPERAVRSEAIMTAKSDVEEVEIYAVTSCDESYSKVLDDGSRESCLPESMKKKIQEVEAEAYSRNYSEAVE